MKLTYYCTGLDADYQNIASDFETLLRDKSIKFREDTMKDIFVDYDFFIDVPEFVGGRKPDYVKIEYDKPAVTRYAFITSYEEIAPAIYRIRLQFDFINPSLGTWHLATNSELELSHFPLRYGMYWQPRVDKQHANIVPSRVVNTPAANRLRFVVTVGLDPAAFATTKRYHARYFISTSFDKSELSTIAANIFRVLTEFKKMVITKTFNGIIEDLDDDNVFYLEENADVYSIEDFPNIYIVPAGFSPLNQDFDETTFNAMLVPNERSSSMGVVAYPRNEVIYGYSVTHSHVTVVLDINGNETRPNEVMRVGNPLSYIDIPFVPNFKTHAYVKIAWGVNGDFHCMLEYGDKSTDLASSFLYMHDVKVDSTTQANMNISSAISVLGGVVTTAGGVVAKNPTMIASGALATSSAIGNIVNAPPIGNFGGSGNAMLALTFGGEAGGYPAFTNGFCFMIYSCPNIREIDDDIDRYGGICNVSGADYGYQSIDFTELGYNRRMYFKFKKVNAIASNTLQVTNDPRFTPLMKQILERGVTVWNTSRTFIGSVGHWNE